MNTPKHRQQWLFDLLKSEPTLSYVETWQKYDTKCRKSESTFKKDWKKAQEQLKEYTRVINKAKLEESIKTEKQAVKRDILSKHQAMEVLTTIARGTARQMPNGTLKPTSNSDMIRAVSELAKFEGWYAPAKQEVMTKIFKGVDLKIEEC